MASSVFYKFKSQKEQQRVPFDGTGISVFELKREIIKISQLGDGSDFDLSIYNQDTNEEYDDDTIMIPRSTSVIARRLPASKPGQGRAARYISGKMPANARTSHRPDQSTAAAPTTKNHNAGPPAGQSEEDRIAAMMQEGQNQWEQTKQRMAGAAPVFNKNFKRSNAQVPDHPPPSTYICHRCKKRGHWIQACPTNNDPAWDNQPRVKRTTGIPTSFLQKIEKPASSGSANDGLTDDSQQPTSIMINADGDLVRAVPDQASWDQFKAKTEASASKKSEAAAGSKELQDRGLECPIDKRLFVDPMKTPCCKKTFCNDCVENALINSDFVCPDCKTEGVLIDDLTPDDEMVSKIRAYEQELKGANSKAKSPALEEGSPIKEKVSASETGPNESVPVQHNGSPRSPSAGSTTSDNAKKRRAEEDLPNTRVPTGPAAMQREKSNSTPTQDGKSNQQPIGQDAFEQWMQSMGMPPMNMANMPADMSNMSMPGMMNMNMNPAMVNPMMMNPMMMHQQFGMNGMGNGMGYGNQQNWYSGMNNGNAWNNGANTGNMYGNGKDVGQAGRTFQAQNRFGAEDDAYMRKPVNPNRRKVPGRARPTDYRELGGA